MSSESTESSQSDSRTSRSRTSYSRMSYSRASTLDVRLSLLPSEKRRCNWITGYVIVQCLLVFAGGFTIHYCVWFPEQNSGDWDKLARIMYLYDPAACHYALVSSPSLMDVHLSNDTRGARVLPIRWTPAVTTVSLRLSTTTRRYIFTSMLYHLVWILSAIVFAALKNVKKSRILKIAITTFFVVTYCAIVFDVIMAILNITHIQKSLTKGMILRYSGWSVETKLNDYEGFGGWLPIAATACWMRGIVFFCLNVYCLTTIHRIRLRLKKSEVRKRLQLQENPPIPDVNLRQQMEDNVLYYRNGDAKPTIGKKIF